MVGFDAFLSKHPVQDALRIVASFLGQNQKRIQIETRIDHYIYWIGYSPDFDLSRVQKDLRTQLHPTGWHFVTNRSRRLADLPCFGIGPVLLRVVNVAYHATRASAIPCIREQGLLPSNAERQATDFPDTEGVIHVCAKLTGKEKDRDSAVWWMKQLSQRNRFNETSWGIVRIDMSQLPSAARVYQDMHSDSGLIVDGIESIPATLITEVPSIPDFILNQAAEE